MTIKTNGRTAGTGNSPSFDDYEDDVTFNLRRAEEERIKAEQSDCDFERRWRLEIATIFARRAHAASALH
jgi:hypothetical protein